MIKKYFPHVNLTDDFEVIFMQHSTMVNTINLYRFTLMKFSSCITMVVDFINKDR